jgi:two-component system sensor histidine kinase BaeS
MFRFQAHSLYWRIAIGFIACIAIVLAIQGVLLLWMVSRFDPDSRTNFTLRVANDLAHELVTHPELDVDRFVRAHYPDPPRAFYVIMTDRTVVAIGDRAPQESAVDGVLRQFERPNLTAIPRSWEVAPYWAAPILVAGHVRGTVAVVPQEIMQELGPRIAVTGIALLIAGTLLAAQFIFTPAHRRLTALQEAARELGAGNLEARAPSGGRDEVSAVARVFNQMAEAIAEHAKEIAEADRMRRLLLADVSHELMTPLTAMRGYQEKLAADRRVSAASDLMNYVGIIGEESLRMEHIVRDLLDLARLEGGGGSLDTQDVFTESLLGRVAARHESAALERGVTLVTHVDAGAELVWGDPLRLEQALQNLAANALRHVNRGGTVSVIAKLNGQQVEIAVADTGSGVAPEHIPFIFDRFYKADPSRAASDAGSGLGLSIVKAIVERHGGSVTVTSEPDVQTVFTIALPSVAHGVDADTVF